MPDPKDFKIRFPSVEVFAIRSGGAFGARELPLTPLEKKKAKDVFGASVDLDVVRIVITPFVNAPTTLGNYIRTAVGSMPDSTLIHELTHIWQFQNKGTAYISDSSLHQIMATLSSGDRNAAYNVTIVPGKSFHDYQAEHQAMIVETYFADANARNNLDYQRMIEEVRKSRPLAASVRMKLILEEAAFGADAFTQRLLPPKEIGDAGVPLLRIEF
jgi:hypothetical protein